MCAVRNIPSLCSPVPAVNVSDVVEMLWVDPAHPFRYLQKAVSRFCHALKLFVQGVVQVMVVFVWFGEVEPCQMYGWQRSGSGFSWQCSVSLANLE